MENSKKTGRYSRLAVQLETLLRKCENTESRMATVIAVLHHKMDHFFWTGFYILQNDRLLVKMYQGPAACMELRKNTGVCWTAINEAKTIVVRDVEQFPGHIACDSRSKSEIAVPFRDPNGKIVGVLDIDSQHTGNFDDTDARELEKILEMIFTVK